MKIFANFFNTIYWSYIMKISLILIPYIILYVNRYAILRFILLPTPMIGYSLLKLISLFITDNLLLSLLKMRQEAEKQFYNIDIIPIVLCIGYKPFNIHQESFSNEYLSYTITGKQILLHIRPGYVIQVLNILESIWNSKPFHSIIVHCSIYNFNDTNNIINELNKIREVTEVTSPIFIYFDYDSPQSTFCAINSYKELGFKVNNNSISNLYDLWHEFRQDLLNILLTSPGIINYDTLNYIDNIKDQAVDSIFKISGAGYDLQGVYFYSSYNNNITSLEYVLNNIVNSACSEAKYNKHNLFLRINKLMMFVISIVCCVCGWVLLRNGNKLLSFYNNITETLQTKETSNINMIENYISILEYKPNIITKSSLPNTHISLKKLKTKILTDMEQWFWKKNNIVSTQDMFINPTNTVVFDNINQNISYWTNLYKKFSYMKYNFTDTDKALYNKNVIDNINLLHDTWLNGIADNWELLQQLNLMNDKMNAIYNGGGSIEEYQSLISVYYNLETLIKNSYHDWWLHGKLDSEYNNMIQNVKNLPNIGFDLYNKLVDNKNNKIEVLSNMILMRSHKVIDNSNIIVIISKDGDKKEVQFSNQMRNFITTIEGLLNHKLLLLNSKVMIPPILNSNQYYIWNTQTVQKVLSYKEEYNKFINIVNTSNLNTKITQSLINICNKKLHKHIYYILLETGTLVNTEYSLNKAAVNMGSLFLGLNDIQKFSSISLNGDLEFISIINRQNIINMTNKVKEIVGKSILTNYQYIDKWNGNNDIIQVLFGKPANQLGDIIENMILQFKTIKSEVIEHILTSSYELTTHEYKYLKYLSDTMLAYESGARNDLGIAKEYLLSLLSLDIKSQKIMAADIDLSRDIAFYTQVFKTSIQTQINKIISQKSIIMFNDLIDYYEIYLKDYLPFNINGSPAKVENIITFIKKYQSIKTHLKNDTQLFVQFPNIINDIEFLDKLVEFIHVDSGDIFVDFDMQDCNNEFKSQCNNINMIIHYEHKFGDIMYTEPLNVFHKHTMNKGYNLNVKIVNSGTMEVAPYTNNSHIVTKHDMISMKYNGSFGLFQFIKQFQTLRSGVNNNDVIIKIPIKIFSPATKISPMEEDYIITYLKIRNWPNIHGYNFTRLA